MSYAPSSPRLPSPPPPAEIQIGSKSPSGGPAANLHATDEEQSLLDANSERRIHPGTKSADMAAGPPLVPLNELDSAFQLQEHLAALHYHHTEAGTIALTRATAMQLAQPPAGIDRTLWLYELCRFLISHCNALIVGFLFDTPPCSASTCPEMRASEWQFLCAVHEQPKSCCAIDYCCHTLDWAANVVTDQKLFPSRFAVLHDTHSKNVGIKNLVNVFRRLHRIFAHAWFQHRSVFWSVEGQTGLYVFFKTVCDLNDLLPAENYKLPPEAEGLESPSMETEAEKPPPTILKALSHQRDDNNEEDNLFAVGRTNTRRHIRSSPSTGSAVSTVVEADEDDNEGVSQRMKNMHITATELVEEESDAEEVPVMVERSAMAHASPWDTAPPDAEEADAGTAAESDADQTVLSTGEASSSDTAAETADASAQPAEHETGGSEESSVDTSDQSSELSGSTATGDLPNNAVSKTQEDPDTDGEQTHQKETADSASIEPSEST